jgi:lysophospholipase L1-like esterase
MLQAGCAGMNTGAGTPRVTCTYDPKLLSESDFVANDLSTADYFHPSFTGQAKMAENAWQAGPWASVPLP